MILIIVDCRLTFNFFNASNLIIWQIWKLISGKGQSYQWHLKGIQYPQMLAAFKDILLGLYDNQTPHQIQEIYDTPGLAGLENFDQHCIVILLLKKKCLPKQGIKTCMCM